MNGAAFTTGRDRGDSDARRMRSEGLLDALVPAFVVPYAVWIVYVHAIVATQSSFLVLMQGLPLAALVAVAATLAWFRLPDPPEPAAGSPPANDVVNEGTATGLAGIRRVATRPTVVLALAALWAGLLQAGMPYPLFWWGALLATGWAWIGNLRGPLVDAPSRTASQPSAWMALLVAAAAVCVTLVASRPDPDDTLHLSIPATLLRFPQHPVSLHDTLYRLPDAPILTPFYRLNGYDVLIGALARLTGIDHMVIAYLVLPSLFAVLCVVAWVFLLRRVVPARWPMVLPILFFVVLALGEAHRAYGNFAFVRLFQGKAIMATCMVPVIAGSALLFVRNGGLRHWLLLFAAQIAAVGTAATALFVAPAAAALGLAGGWSANAASSRRFALGMLASAYVFAAAWVMASGTQGGHGFVSSNPVLAVPQMLDDTWGAWSTGVLLAALLAAWAFVRDPLRARYLSAGAFWFLLAVLNPYTVRFVADHLVGVYTYWRLTWALPLPLFLAVLLDGVLGRVLRMRSRLLTACAGALLAGFAIALAGNVGTLRAGNGTTVGAPGIKVYPIEYTVAKQVARTIPEQGVVLAPESVALWLPTFVVHPQLLGARLPYLTQGFAPPEAGRRRALMRYVAGESRTVDSQALFAEALQRYGLTAVVLKHSAPWREDMEKVLDYHAWRPLSRGAYDVWVRGDNGRQD